MLPTGDAELSFLSIEEAARLLRGKKISPVELVNSVLLQIEGWNPRLHAFITILGEQARNQARRAEREIYRNGPRQPLHGIPLSLKDNIYTKGIRTTAGSKILANFVPTSNSTIANALDQSGAILVGKTNLHEFAYGISSENPHFGSVHNPWGQDRISGGSSGGSAVAVATGMGFGSVGTDTAGSIRVPPALCGVVGLKPTAGLVDLSGVVPLSTTSDTAGFIGRSAIDVCILLQTFASRYPKSARRPDFRKLRNGKPQRFRLGWPEQHFFDCVDEEVRRNIDEAMKCFRSLGATIQKISLPHVAQSLDAGARIQAPEATFWHQSQGFFPQRAAEYGADVRERLEFGLQITGIDYLRSLEMKHLVEAEFDEAFEHIDAIVAPASPIPAPQIGQAEVEIGGKRQAVRAALISVNRPASVSGNPAMTIPCGFTAAGLPVGLQLIGRRWGEAELVAIAHSYQRETDWHKRRPT